MIDENLIFKISKISTDAMARRLLSDIAVLSMGNTRKAIKDQAYEKAQGYNDALDDILQCINQYNHEINLQELQVDNKKAEKEGKLKRSKKSNQLDPKEKT